MQNYCTLAMAWRRMRASQTVRSLTIAAALTLVGVELPINSSVVWGQNRPAQAVVQDQTARAPANNAAANGLPNGAPQQNMQVLAVVNGQQITRQQIANECLRRWGEEVLEGIVNKMLIFDELQRRNIVITEKDINDEIISQGKKFGMSGEKWVELICTRRNISVDRLKNDFVWRPLALRRLAANDIAVSPQEIQEQMEFEFGEKVQVREIVLENRDKANQVLQFVRQNPQEFENMAKTHSVNPNSQALKGLLPPLARHSGNPEMEKIVFAMKPGDISEIISMTEDSFVILKCERIFPATEVPTEQLPAIHEQLIQKMSEAKLADAATNLFKQLQQQVRLVNVMNDPQMREQKPGVAAILNDREISVRDLAEECITHFGDAMLETEINRQLLLQELQSAKVQVTQEEINEEIKRAAEAFGYYLKDGTVDIDAWLKYTTGNKLERVDFYVEDEVWPTVALKKLVANHVEVTQEDLQMGFESNFGPRVETLAIVFSDHRTALKVWQMANANPKPEYFGELANQYSVEPASQANFGQVPPVQKYGGRPELEQEAFALKPGEISKVVQVGEHFIIMMCQGHTTPVVTEFDEVREYLTRDIREKKMRIAMDDLFANMRTSAQIDNFLAGTSQPGQAAIRAAKQNEPASTQPRR